MKPSDVLYFDALGVEPINPQLNWRTDRFPRLSSLVWIWQGRFKAAANEEGLTEFVDDCYDASLICGFNCHASVSLVKAEILATFGPEYYEEMAVGEALDKRKRIDLMLRTKKWVDARTLGGRPKFPTMEELYSRCFPGQPFDITSARERVEALQRCLPRVVLEGLVELKQREYPENAI